MTRLQFALLPAFLTWFTWSFVVLDAFHIFEHSAGRFFLITIGGLFGFCAFYIFDELPDHFKSKRPSK